MLVDYSNFAEALDFLSRLGDIGQFISSYHLDLLSLSYQFSLAILNTYM